MNNLWKRLSLAKEDNSELIEKLEKMVEDEVSFDDLPDFYQPKSVLSVYRHDSLETLMLDYEKHFRKVLDTMEIGLELDGWEILLEYCVENSRPLEKISNIDIYKIKNPKNFVLEEYEIYSVPITYQKPLFLRRLLHLRKSFTQRLSN